MGKWVFDPGGVRCPAGRFGQYAVAKPDCQLSIFGFARDLCVAASTAGRLGVYCRDVAAGAQVRVRRRRVHSAASPERESNHHGGRADRWWRVRQRSLPVGGPADRHRDRPSGQCRVASTRERPGLYRSRSTQSRSQMSLGRQRFRRCWDHGRDPRATQELSVAPRSEPKQARCGDSGPTVWPQEPAVDDLSPARSLRALACGGFATGSTGISRLRPSSVEGRGDPRASDLGAGSRR